MKLVVDCQGVRGPSMAGLDNSSQSLLKFSGPRDVHGIYNWLLDSGLGGLSDTADVARLLSPVPFLGASLLRSSFKVLGLSSTPVVDVTAANLEGFHVLGTLLIDHVWTIWLNSGAPTRLEWHRWPGSFS